MQRAEHAWFADLLATPTAGLRPRFSVEAQVGAHRVRLGEMTGAPGELQIMPRTVLQGAAHDALERARIILTEWIARRPAT